MKRGAFTLIELTVVILILGIAAAAASLKMHSPVRAAQAADTIGAIVDYDRTTRTAARQQDRPLHLVVDLSGGVLSRTDQQGRPVATASMNLGEGIRIKRLLVGEHDKTDGVVSLCCSRAGAMPTYAILVEAAGARTQWLVIVGLSGQLVQVDSEREAQDIVAAADRSNAG